jgi:23S rRNA pseudouridine1911/1915/1917 synthase
MRLDNRVANEFGLTRRGALAAIRHGQVDLAGRTCLEPGREVEPGEPLRYVPNRPRPATITGRLRILYEDSHILIVDKPAGVLTQPTPERERDTLLERAGRYLKRTRRLTQPYIGIVHRIDQDTSGAILLVCSPKALRPFQELFRAHASERVYLAVVQGAIEPLQGTIALPVAADRGNRRPGARRLPARVLPAVTRYEVLEQFGSIASRLACRLQTGRTHQIRIHLAEVGHPVVGEPVYQRRQSSVFPVPFRRQALHSHVLGFVHPMTGFPVRVEAPIPEDLVDLIAVLRHRFGS